MTIDERAHGTPEEEGLPRFEKVRSRDGNWYLACGEVITFLFEYLDEEVAAERKQDFDRHLEVCPSCRNYLTTFRDSLLLVRRAGQLEEAEIPELPQYLIDAIVRARG